VFKARSSPDEPGTAVKVAVAVFLGANFTRLRADNPFRELKPLLEKLRAETPYVVADFHAWATGEKRLFFAAAAGLCTAVIGSHSRVQTADETILDGTAVICDAGRTGSTESVGGTDTAVRIQEYLTGIPDWTKDAWDKCELQGVIVEADGEGRALSIKRLRIPVPAGNQKMPEPDISEEG
jgi:calcineurin-like phosphoesterase